MKMSKLGGDRTQRPVFPSEIKPPLKRPKITEKQLPKSPAPAPFRPIPSPRPKYPPRPEDHKNKRPQLKRTPEIALTAADIKSVDLLQGPIIFI